MAEKRTRKTSWHRPRELERQIRKMHDISCQIIENESRNQNKKQRPITMPTKHITRWNPGFCKICGEHMECITHSHAELHGYKRAEDLIAAEMIIFD
jgi:hypothetical protein